MDSKITTRMSSMLFWIVTLDLPWDYGTEKLKQLKKKHYQLIFQKEHGGKRNVREVIPHGCKHDKLMALVGWYVGGNARVTGGYKYEVDRRRHSAQAYGQRSRSMFLWRKRVHLRGCEHKNKGTHAGPCHINALRLF